MKLSPETGLPELPEGQFWKVEKDGIHKEPFVTLMRRRKWWTPTRVQSIPVLSGWGDPNKEYLDRVPDIASAEFNPENIRRSARRILEILEIQRAKRDARKKNSQLLGAYPPKELGA